MRAHVARTPAEQEQGLGGVSTLEIDEGMLFPFRPAKQESFWNKGMKIPFDLLWIGKDRVIGIEQDIPPERNGIRVLNSTSPVDYVLETRAGWTARNHVSLGDTVIVEKDL